MTAPFQPLSESAYGPAGQEIPISEWRRVAQLAQADLAKNPNDLEAATQLQMALGVLRYHAGQVGQTMTQRSRADTEATTDPGTLASAVMGFGQGASFGLADELAGALTALRGQEPGESFGTAYARGRDLQRAGQTAGEVFHPYASAGADIVGSLATGGLAARGAGRVLPAGLRAAFTAGARPGAQLGDKALSALLGGGASAAYAGANAFGRGEEGVVEDLEGSLFPAGVGFALGGPVTALGQTFARRSAVNAANEVTAVRGPERQAAQIAADQERAGLYRARRLDAERRSASEASRDAIRDQRARQGLTLGEQRVADIPLNRQVLEDRAVISSLRRAQAEARKTGNPTSVEGRFRAHLARIGTPPEAIERAVERARITPGSGLTSAGNPNVVVPPQTVQPQRGATRGQLDYRQRVLAEGLPAVEGPAVSGAREAGGILGQVVRQPLTDESAAVVQQTLRQLPADQRLALWAQVELGRDMIPGGWYDLLASLLRPGP